MSGQGPDLCPTQWHAVDNFKSHHQVCHRGAGTRTDYALWVPHNILILSHGPNFPAAPLAATMHLLDTLLFSSFSVLFLFLKSVCEPIVVEGCVFEKVLGVYMCMSVHGRGVAANRSHSV